MLVTAFSIGVFLFVILPIVAALGAIVVSLRSLGRAFSITQVALAIPSIALAGFSLFILKRIILDKAWPTYLPHVAILLAVPLAAIQWHRARRVRRDSNVRREQIQLVTGVILVMVSAGPLT